MTAADVQKAAAEYLATGARSVVIARPSGEPVAPPGDGEAVSGVGALGLGRADGRRDAARAGRRPAPGALRAARVRPARW